MLTHLTIRNFTIIDSLDIDFNPGFSVITGETGAGKSIILGAIALLMGQRADGKQIRSGADKCVIEARFDLRKYNLREFFDSVDIDYDDECIIRRELTAAGKSRSFVNDTPAPLSALKVLGEHLLDVHSQHQNLLLAKDDFQLEVTDIIADDRKLLDDYRQTFREYNEKARALDTLKKEIAANRQNYDFMKFQYDELTAAGLKEGEQEELEQKSTTMSHAEEIKGALYSVDEALSGEGSGAVQALKNSISQLRHITAVMPDVEELAQRMDSCQIELKDIAYEVSSRLEKVDFDPAEQEQVDSRLDRLYDLQRKYQTDDVAGLIAKRDELERSIGDIDNGDDRVIALEQQMTEARAKAEAEAAKLHDRRAKAAKKIEKEMLAKLQPLGLPNVRFAVNIEKKELSSDGADKVVFLFSANPGSEMQPVSQVASGGEIARVMLALKAMISGAMKLPTIIFDEIDTGVSGKIAQQMAFIMKEMGQADRQVISITHLPQIAALGTTHYKVYKEQTAEGTNSRMQQLSDDDRIKEIAQMLSGSEVSKAAISNAKELLATRF